MSTAFPDVAPWPEAEPNPRVVIGNNEPPLEERIVLEFEDAIDATPGLRDRINQLIAKAETLPDCKDADTAGKLGDFKKMCGTAASKVNESRERIKAPYLAATRALDGRGNALRASILAAGEIAQSKLDVYVAEENRKAKAERDRIAAETARLQREHDERVRAAAAEAARLQAEEDERAAAAGREAQKVEAVVVPEPEPEPIAAPQPKKGPMVRGDYGSSVGTKTVWKHELTVPVKQLPKEVLNHPKVAEAVDTVIAGMIRGGHREIKGVRIWDEQVANVR